MNVSGGCPSPGMYTYNSIRLNELRSRQLAGVQEHGALDMQTMQQELAAVEIQQEKQREQEAMIAQQTYTSYDYAKEYRPGEEYSMIGADSDVTKLDVERAVSDLERDKIL